MAKKRVGGDGEEMLGAAHLSTIFFCRSMQTLLYVYNVDAFVCIKEHVNM